MPVTIEEAIAAVCQAARAKADTADAEGRVEVRGETVFGVLMEQGAGRDDARALTREAALGHLGGEDTSESHTRTGLGPNYDREQREDAYLVPLSACGD